jgi:hypothetical protein
MLNQLTIKLNACRVCENCKEQMGMVERDHYFRCSLYKIVSKLEHFFSQVNGIVGFVFLVILSKLRVH